jgi:hypothetical protein
VAPRRRPRSRGALVRGQARGGELRELIGFDRSVEGHERDRRLTAIGVGDAHHAGVEHGGCWRSTSSISAGADRGALDLDELLQAIADLELAVVADRDEVAGAQPAIVVRIAAVSSSRPW